jgi:hypothetical protein
VVAPRAVARLATDSGLAGDDPLVGLEVDAARRMTAKAAEYLSPGIENPVQGSLGVYVPRRDSLSAAIAGESVLLIYFLAHAADGGHRLDTTPEQPDLAFSTQCPGMRGF